MEVYVARQPIFDETERTFGYELLYRSNEKNVFPDINGDQATAEVIITSFLNIGIDLLSEGKPCFINFTEKLLRLKLPTYFRPREIIVEILENIEPSQELISICQELKQLGYRIALDDFVLKNENPYIYPLLALVNIIKIDFLNTPLDMRKQIEVIAKTLGIQLLAEKVETREEFEYAKQLGYDFFQGYFFSRPVIVSSHDVPTFFHSYYDIIHQLSMTEPSIDRITELIEQDLSLSYKLLKLINSPAYRPKYKINSIRQAVVLLGLIEIQKWIYVLAVRETAGTNRTGTEEILRTCLTRGKMCESIAKLIRIKTPTSSYFLTGMFSLMDTILQLPMGRILADLPLEEDIVEALNGKENPISLVLTLVKHIENADWEKISKLSKELSIDEKIIFQCYTDAIRWSSALIQNEWKHKK